LDTVGIAPTLLITTKIFANETFIHTSEWRACLLIRSFTGAGAFRLEHKGLCTKCIFSRKGKKKHLIEKEKAYENPGH
jgi:hypothetical protein